MSNDYVERLRGFLDAHRPDSARHVTADVLATLPNPDGRGWRHLTGEDLRAALDELKWLRADNAILLEGNQRLQTMNEGLRQMAIQSREAADSWHQATIDLYSGRAEPQQPGRRVVRCGAACSEMHTYVLGWCEQAVPPELHVDADAQVRPAPKPEPPTRRNALLAAIQREGGDWSPLRARTALMSAGYDVASNLAAQEMKTLAAHGFLEPVRPRAYTYRLKADAPQQPEKSEEAP